MAPKPKKKSPAKRQEVRLVWRRIQDIEPNPRNPKEHDIPGIKASIRRFGFRGAIVMNGDRVTSEGHGRTEALMEMWSAGEPVPEGIRLKGKYWLAPLLVGMKFKSDREADLFTIPSNQLTIRGGWKEDLLAELLAETRSDPSGFDGTGFAEPDLEKLLRKLNRESEASRGQDDAPPLPKKAITKPGDVWILGDHRLLCGSCLELGSLLDVPAADLMVTDPPYGIDYTSIGRRIRKEKTGVDRTHSKIENDALGSDALQDALTQWFEHFRSILRPGAAYYVFSPSGELMLTMILAMQRAAMPFRWSLVWRKDALVMSRADYHLQHETIFYGWIEGAAHHAVADRTQSSVWDAPRPRVSAEHPTMKPVSLYERAYTNSSDPGDVVIEPFSGSGTAILAGESTSRVVRATELDPKYCDVAVQRWEELTGGKARRERKG